MGFLLLYTSTFILELPLHESPARPGVVASTRGGTLRRLSFDLYCKKTYRIDTPERHHSLQIYLERVTLFPYCAAWPPLDNSGSTSGIAT